MRDGRPVLVTCCATLFTLLHTAVAQPPPNARPGGSPSPPGLGPGDGPPPLPRHQPPMHRDRLAHQAASPPTAHPRQWILMTPDHREAFRVQLAQQAAGPATAHPRQWILMTPDHRETFRVQLADQTTAHARQWILMTPDHREAFRVQLAHQAAGPAAARLRQGPATAHPRQGLATAHPRQWILMTPDRGVESNANGVITRTVSAFLFSRKDGKVYWCQARISQQPNPSSPKPLSASLNCYQQFLTIPLASISDTSMTPNPNTNADIGDNFWAIEPNGTLVFCVPASYTPVPTPSVSVWEACAATVIPSGEVPEAKHARAGVHHTSLRRRRTD